MNWTRWRRIPWIDTRAASVAATSNGGSLFDLGSSDGQTLRHVGELRSDLKFFSVDIAGRPSCTPDAKRAGSLKGKITMNFCDDPTHLRPVPVGSLSQAARDGGLVAKKSGRSRNWIFAAAYPFLSLLPATRKKYIAKLHWLGWSVYLVAQKPAV